MWGGKQARVPPRPSRRPHPSPLPSLTGASVALDAAALAREVARDWTPRAVTAGVDLGYEGDESLLIHGEKLLLREALNNLLDNALLYAGKGSMVTVRVMRQEALALIEVEDNGPGLASTDLTHLFERFWRASELPGGCGLGLAIVNEIAHRHGGSASARSVPGQGLKISLRLPLAN